MRRRRGWAGRAPQVDAGCGGGTLEGEDGVLRFCGSSLLVGGIVLVFSRSVCACRGGKEIEGEKFIPKVYILYDALTFIKDLK